MQTVVTRTAVIVAIAMLVGLNAFAFRFVGDVVTSVMLVSVGFAYGRWGK